MTTATLPTVELTNITVALAEKWLACVPDFQRKIDEKQVKKIVLAIQRNEWRENGATIVFNEKGELIDGQHRLKAITIAGKTVKSLVVRDVSKEEATFQTIGDEKPRRLTDFMHCAHVNTVASTVKMYWGLVNGVWPVGHGGQVPPISDVLRLAKKWESDIVPLIPATWAAGRVLRQHAFCAFLVFYHTKIRPVSDPERVAEFFARVGDGLNLNATDPVYKLRNRFMEVASTGKIQRTAAQAIILKAFYLYLDGKPCTLLRFEPNREAFPELRGYKK